MTEIDAWLEKLQSVQTIDPANFAWWDTACPLFLQACHVARRDRQTESLNNWAAFLAKDESILHLRCVAPMQQSLPGVPDRAEWQREWMERMVTTALDLAAPNAPNWQAVAKKMYGTYRNKHGAAALACFPESFWLDFVDQIERGGGPASRRVETKFPLYLPGGNSFVARFRAEAAWGNGGSIHLDPAQVLLFRTDRSFAETFAQVPKSFNQDYKAAEWRLDPNIRVQIHPGDAEDGHTLHANALEGGSVGGALYIAYTALRREKLVRRDVACSFQLTADGSTEPDGKAHPIKQALAKAVAVDAHFKKGYGSFLVLPHEAGAPETLKYPPFKRLREAFECACASFFIEGEIDVELSSSPPKEFIPLVQEKLSDTASRLTVITSGTKEGRTAVASQASQELPYFAAKWEKAGGLDHGLYHECSQGAAPALGDILKDRLASLVHYEGVQEADVILNSNETSLHKIKELLKELLRVRPSGQYLLFLSEMDELFDTGGSPLYPELDELLNLCLGPDSPLRLLVTCGEPAAVLFLATRAPGFVHLPKSRPMLPYMPEALTEGARGLLRALAVFGVLVPENAFSGLPFYSGRQEFKKLRKSVREIVTGERRTIRTELGSKQRHFRYDLEKRYREVIYQGIPEREKEALHRHAAEYFRTRLYAGFDERSYAESNYLRFFRFEQAEALDDLHQWVAQLAHIPDHEEQRLELVLLYFEAHFWYNDFVKFDFNDELLSAFKKHPLSKEDEAFAELLQRFHSNYPRKCGRPGDETPEIRTRWQTVRAALVNIRRALHCDRPTIQNDRDVKRLRLYALTADYLGEASYFLEEAEFDAHHREALEVITEQLNSENLPEEDRFEEYDWMVYWLLIEQAEMWAQRHDHERALELCRRFLRWAEEKRYGGVNDDHEVMACLYGCLGQCFQNQSDRSPDRVRLAWDTRLLQLFYSMKFHTYPDPPDEYSHAFYHEATGEIARHFTGLLEEEKQDVARSLHEFCASPWPDHHLPDFALVTQQDSIEEFFPHVPTPDAGDHDQYKQNFDDYSKETARKVRKLRQRIKSALFSEAAE